MHLRNISIFNPINDILAGLATTVITNSHKSLEEKEIMEENRSESVTIKEGDQQQERNEKALVQTLAGLGGENKEEIISQVGKLSGNLLHIAKSFSHVLNKTKSQKMNEVGQRAFPIISDIMVEEEIRMSEMVGVLGKVYGEFSSDKDMNDENLEFEIETEENENSDL